MKYSYPALIAVAVVLSGCIGGTIPSAKQWCLLEAKEWLPLVRNDQDTESRMQSQVAVEMQKAGMSEEALTVAGMIQNFRRSITFAHIGQSACDHKQIDIARKALDLGELSLSYAVAENRELGLIELMDLAHRLDRKDLVEKWFKQVQTNENKTRANARISFANVTGGEISSMAQRSSDAEKDIYAGVKDLHGTSGDQAAPNVTVEEIFEALEGAWKRGDKLTAATWLQEARRRIPNVPSVDRVGYWASLCHWEVVTGKLDWAAVDLPKAQAELDRIPPAFDFKYSWAIELAGVYRKLGDEKQAKDLLEKETQAVKKSVIPYFQMDVLGKMAVAAVDSGLMEQANAWWAMAFSEAEKNPNPRSRAVGVIQYLLSHARAGIKPDGAIQEKIAKMKVELPEAYSKIGF
jgi:hypothetical protein